MQYHVRKKMFLVKSELVWGLNCEIAAEIQKEGGMVSVKMTIPVEKFSSGNEDRDEDVKSILKYAEHPRMIFSSEKIRFESLRTALDQGGDLRVSGALKIGGKDFPVTFQVRAKREGQNIIFSGQTEVSLSHFEISPPRMLGGLVANVEDWLELSFNVHSRHVLGVNELGIVER